MAVKNKFIWWVARCGRNRPSEVLKTNKSLNMNGYEKSKVYKNNCVTD